MEQFTEKVSEEDKDLRIILSSYALFIVTSFAVFIILIFLLLGIGSGNSISQVRILQLVTWNQDDLEMIVEDLRSYDVPRVYVNEESIRTYTNLVRLPDGRYMLGDEGPEFSTSEELQRFMKELKVNNIDFSLLDEVQIVTFEVDWMRGFYWVDPDTPTVQAYTSQQHDLTPSGAGWEYVSLGKRYYTEKICDHWYFFELTDRPKTED